MTVPYQLTGRLETGELADLYKASQTPGGEVVVKLFHPRTSDPAYARVLAETSRVLNPLHQPGIVRYVDIGFVKQRLAVVREHVDGYTLGTALQRLNTKEVLLPSAVALYLVIQLAEMVQRAHEAGVIHGAITPGNLLLSREGTPGICDFGALNALMAVPELKQGFATRGRSAYRAPEVGRGEAPTAVSDVYSLGAIAYELLTLREAIVSTGNISTRSGGLPPPSRLDRRINSRLDPLILRAVDPLPNRRFRSAGDFAGALRNFFSAHGGMPGQEDLRRFVRELVPNEVNLSTLGPVPFSEPFTLTAISGAEIANVRAERLEVSVVVRNPFSRSLSEEESQADTTEAPPVFEDFKPQEPSLDLTPVDQAPPNPYTALEPTRFGQQPPVAEAEDTDPSQAGPLEKGWDAPPGAVPPKPRKLTAPQGNPARGSRLKWVEDFSEQKSSDEEKDPDEIPTDPVRTEQVRRATGSRRALTGSRPALPTEPSSPGYVPRDRPEIPQPPSTDENIPIAGGGRRLHTEERNLLVLARRRQGALGVALAIAVVGIFSFSIAVWRFHDPPPQPQAEAAVEGPDPRESAISGAVNQYGVKQPQPQPEREDVAEAPVPDANSAFITLRTNMPARVLIDGEPIRKRTPLTKYPVKPGNRSFTLEPQGSKERVEFSLRFERGQHRIVDQKFESPPRR
jgi:serine/threonine-protein kinase